MKKLLVVFGICILFSSVAWARPKVDLAQIRAERDKGIAKISAEVRDISARYWAGEVLRGHTTMSSLRSNCRHWLGSAEENMRMLDLAEEWIRKGDVPELTPQEREQLDENNRRVKEFLNSWENPAAKMLAEENRKITQMKAPVFELEARYWAWRVAVLQDISYEELLSQSQRWIGEREENQRLMKAIADNIQTGNTAPLSAQERRQLDENRKEIYNYLQ